MYRSRIALLVVGLLVCIIAFVFADGPFDDDDDDDGYRWGNRWLRPSYNRWRNPYSFYGSYYGGGGSPWYQPRRRFNLWAGRGSRFGGFNTYRNFYNPYRYRYRYRYDDDDDYFDD